MALPKLVRYLSGLEASRIVLLCGAGVSYNPPTNLPTVRHFVTTLLRHCGAGRHILEDVVGKMSTEKPAPRFEVLIDEIRKLGDPHLAIGKVFTSHYFNSLHYFLGQMLMRGSAVFTTNFDNCVENAVAPQCYIRKVFNGRELTGKRPLSNVLVKIHGSNPLKPTGANADLVITIRALAKTTQGFVGYPMWRKYLLDLLKNKTVVVLGYSGSDDFDVSPVLSQSSPREVIWLDYHELYRFPKQINRMRENLFPFARTTPIKYFQGRLDAFAVKWLQVLGIATDFPNSYRKAGDSIKRYVVSQFSSVASKEKLINQVLLHYSLYTLVARRRLRARSTEAEIQRVKALYRLGKHRRAAELCRALHKNTLDPVSLVQVLYYRSASLYYVGLLESAAETAQLQVRVARASGDRVAHIHALNNLGAIYFGNERFQDSRVCYERSLRINKSHLSIEGEATATWGLADVSSVEKHNDRAYQLYLRARETYFALGNHFALPWIDMNIGQTLVRIRRARQAEQWLKRAESAFRKAGNSPGLIYTLNALSKSFVIRRQLRLSCRTISEATRLVARYPKLPIALDVMMLFVIVLIRQKRPQRLRREKRRLLAFAISQLPQSEAVELASLLQAKPKRPQLALIERRLLES